MNRSTHIAKKISPLPLKSADIFLCRPIFGIPFFFAVLSVVFFLSFGRIGNAIERILYSTLSRWGEFAEFALTRLGVSDFTVRYLIDGIYEALAAAVAFFPQTVIFFLLI